MEPNCIFSREILYSISRKNVVLIKIANVAQTITATAFKRNVRSKKYFNTPNHNLRRSHKMFADSPGTGVQMTASAGILEPYVVSWAAVTMCCYPGRMRLLIPYTPVSMDKQQAHFTCAVRHWL